MTSPLIARQLNFERRPKKEELSLNEACTLKTLTALSFCALVGLLYGTIAYFIYTVGVSFHDRFAENLFGKNYTN